MSLDINRMRVVDTTIPTPSLLAKQLHQVLTAIFHFFILLFNFVDIHISQLIIPTYMKLLH